MQIAIFGKPTKRTNYTEIFEFIKFLDFNGINYSISDSYAESLSHESAFLGHENLLISRYSKMEEIDKVDYVYCIGGDGTLLEAVMQVGKLGIPILGVNVGRLGFLAQTFPKDLIPTTQLLLQNRCKIDERSMLEINSSPIPIFKDAPYGLNEVTLHKSHSNDMIIIHTYVNGEFLNSYWCDGLMISTSTGSTAYSLSCGGPIIMPSSGVFVITPIAPHSLTVRPFIIPNTSVISLEIESRSGQALVAIDSRTELVPDNFEIAVKKAEFKAKLVQLPDSNYFNTLRSRLNWGVDSRV